MTQKIIPIILGQSQHHTVAQLSPSIAQPILDISLSISSRDINIASLSSWFFIFFFSHWVVENPFYYWQNQHNNYPSQQIHYLGSDFLGKQTIGKPDDYFLYCTFMISLSYVPISLFFSPSNILPIINRSQWKKKICYLENRHFLNFW